MGGCDEIGSIFALRSFKKRYDKNKGRTGMMKTSRTMITNEDFGGILSALRHYTQMET
jgi:hypothetical protein